MVDPYLYDTSWVLKNKLDITEQDELDDAEADYVSLRIREIAEDPVGGKYDVEHFCRIHKYIFQDIYDWAGDFRVIDIEKEEPALGGLSIEYAKHSRIGNDLSAAIKTMRERDWGKMFGERLVKEFASDLATIWKVHPFREGNTRTTIIFCCDFLKSRGIEIDRVLFEKHSAYVRTALVAYNAFFSDIGDYSKKEYLEKIIADAIRK